MAEHRRIWPFLVYGALVAIASARRRETERTPDTEGYNIVRKPYRIIYPAPDESGESRAKLVRRPRLIPTKGRRSRWKTISRFPRNCAERGSRQGAAGNGSLANSLGRVERYLLARLCERK